MTISRRNVIKILAGTVPAIGIPKAFSAAVPFPNLENSIPGQSEELPLARKYNFNPGWKVLVGDSEDAFDPGYDDRGWRDRTMPYAWNEDDAFSKDIAQLSTGIAWYRKHFTLPASMQGKKIFLEFEGIRQAGTFYLNGKKIGLSENGVMAFGFDISDTANYGDRPNVLAARFDNSWDYREEATHTKFQWEDRNFYANYGGINKNVLLHVTDRLYQTLPLYAGLGTTGVYVYAGEFDIAGKKATLHASSEV
jgi:beta-galactosidase